MKKLHNELSDTSEQFSELQDVCETLRNESHDRQLTIEELEEDLAKAKNEIEVPLIIKKRIVISDTTLY